MCEIYDKGILCLQLHKKYISFVKPVTEIAL